MKSILICLVTVAFLAVAIQARAASDEITVISREDGSGTRDAFVDLFQITGNNARGKKVDLTVDTADITNSTSVVLISVAGNPNAIGYVSLGSMNDSVKPAAINGTKPSMAAIKSGDYIISRPFNIATKATLSPAANDFISFVFSSEGQAVIEERGYVGTSPAPTPFKGGKVAGRLVIGGSSSVTPVMEKLKEAYTRYNPDVNIQIQQSDSTTGMAGVVSGIIDIGMASREVKPSELAKGLVSRTIARDGIVVIINKKNPVTTFSVEQVKTIYMGKISHWSQLR